MPDAITQPTEEGRRRYPPDGYRHEPFIGPLPCTCTPDCPDPCAGNFRPGPCACEACGQAAIDAAERSDERDLSE